MKNLNLMFAISFVIFTMIPFANATALFEGEIITGQNNQFYGTNDLVNEIKVNEITSQKCKIVLSGVEEWVSLNEIKNIDEFEVEVKSVDSNKCEIKVRPRPIEGYPNIFIKYIHLDVNPDANGYHYVEDGQIVRYEIGVYSDREIPRLEYVLYNNGYPWGEGATKYYKGIFDIQKGDNEFWIPMQFDYEDDTTYNSGSFITSLVIDKDKKKLENPVYQGISVYIQDSNHGCHTFKDPRGQDLDGGICLVTNSEINHYEKTTICKEKEDTLSVGGNSYRLSYSKEMSFNVNNQLVEVESGFISTGENYWITANEVNSDSPCYLVTLGCRGETCYYEDRPRIVSIEPRSGGKEIDGEKRSCKSELEKCESQQNDENCEEEYLECKGYAEEEKGLPSCSDGCFVNHDLNKCLPFGTRLNYEGTPSYCDIIGELKSQSEDGIEANNNYECKSNSARYGVCENIKEQQSAMKKVFEWLSKFFGG